MDASGGAAREVALPVVADSGRLRLVTGAGDGRTGHGGDGLEVEVERREEEARALMRLGAPDHGFGGSVASPDWDEDGGGDRVRGSGDAARRRARRRARRSGGARCRRRKGEAAALFSLSLCDGATREEGIGREARVQEGEIEGKRDDGARERALRCGLGLEQRGGWA